MSWREFKLFVKHLSTDSAYYRARNPRSWNWDTNTELMSAILYVLQWANWQRGGGEGEKPKPIQRPDDSPTRMSADKREISERKQAMQDELTRRRTRRAGSNRRHNVMKEVVDVG